MGLLFSIRQARSDFSDHGIAFKRLLLQPVASRLGTDKNELCKAPTRTLGGGPVPRGGARQGVEGLTVATTSAIQSGGQGGQGALACPLRAGCPWHVWRGLGWGSSLLLCEGQKSTRSSCHLRPQPSLEVVSLSRLASDRSSREVQVGPGPGTSCWPSSLSCSPSSASRHGGDSAMTRVRCRLCHRQRRAYQALSHPEAAAGRQVRPPCAPAGCPTLRLQPGRAR